MAHRVGKLLGGILRDGPERQGEQMEDWDEVVFERISQLQATDGDLGPVEADFVYKREGKKVGQTQRMSEAKLVAVIENLRKAGRVVPEA